MKLFTAKAALAAIGASLVLAASASAQTSVMRVDIPFAFSAGDETFPAGVYSVRMDQPFNRAMLLSGTQTRTTMVRLRLAAADRSPLNAVDGKLLFNRYGERYVLAEVWAPGRVEGWRTNTSRLEKELARIHGPVQVATVGALR
jgi:hypothetical protein